MVNTFSLLKKAYPCDDYTCIYTHICIYTYICKFSVVRNIFTLATDQLDLDSSNDGILC